MNLLWTGCGDASRPTKGCGLPAQREKVPKFLLLTGLSPDKHFLRWQTGTSAWKYWGFLDPRNAFLGRLSGDGIFPPENFRGK